MQTLFYITVLQIREDSSHVAELCQLFQPILMLSGCQISSWHAVQLVGVLLQIGRCELNITLQMWSQQCKVQQDHHLPWRAVYAFVRSHINLLAVHMAWHMSSQAAKTLSFFFMYDFPKPDFLHLVEEQFNWWIYTENLPFPDFLKSHSSCHLMTQKILDSVVQYVS